MQRVLSAFLVALVLVAVGCAKRAPTTAAEYLSSASYQNRELLQTSLFRSDQALISGEEIRLILESRIELPSSSHLAILRLGSRSEILAWSLLAPSSAFASDPMEALDSSPKIERISWLPSLLVPDKLSVPLLREAAARFQADLLLVLRTPCQDFRDYHWLRKDKARTYCAAEAVLLDVRTGIIPFSSSSVQMLEVVSAEGDISFYESTQRSESEATTRALAEVASKVADFLNGLP